MAVLLDQGTVRDAVDPEVYREAEELLAAGRLGEITAVGGGAAGTVHNGPGAAYEVWVGVVSRALTGECTCSDDADPDELCAHAVALTLGAIDQDFGWSSAATPPSAAPAEPDTHNLVEIAASLPPRRLAMLVAEHAATDRRLETRLLTAAGKLGALDESELFAVRKTIDSLAAEAMTGRWGLNDLVNAGQWILDEVELLALRPPTEDALLVVEHAARVWDDLSVHLYGGWGTREYEPAEIGDALRAVHVDLCEELEPDPDELVGRLTEIVEAAEVESCLDEPEDYLAVLGPGGVAALRERRR
jgi:hypothetical protein